MSLGLKTIEYLLLVAGMTGVEPAPCAVTGRHLNRLTSIPNKTNFLYTVVHHDQLYFYNWWLHFRIGLITPYL